MAVQYGEALGTTMRAQKSPQHSRHKYSTNPQSSLLAFARDLWSNAGSNKQSVLRIILYCTLHSDQMQQAPQAPNNTW
ncbi:hypothetical protein I7I53_05329 [Histoplasma capsulatum var. duboisii H88]|uniref:Uncharacterized protein n=1 Tax=Ajellomyces capsulatus (strain H88) TaxID=544711 RepID=A0A8A1LT54_AJEC8|nr:hypothetical protein I7I53_05329 [Histoplasma capsulatum var. duboisii H88]